MKKALLISLLITLGSQICLAQIGELVFTDITVEDGLSNNRVLCITQDSLGFMWFGTYSGLNRYDGYESKIYKHDPNDPESLSWDYIWSMQEDNKGNLWIGTDAGGLNRFDKEREKFIRYESDDSDSTGISRNEFISTIYEDKQGKLWIGTGRGLHWYDAENDKFIRYTYAINDTHQLSSEFVTYLYEDSRNNFWVGTWHEGLKLLDRTNRTVKQFKHDPEISGSISNNLIYSIFEDQSGLLWIGTDNGFDRFRFSGKNTIFEHYRTSISPQISAKKIFDLYERAGIEKLTNAYQESDYIDKNGNIWIGTTLAGIKFYNPMHNAFNSYKYQPCIPGGLNNSSVLAFHADANGSLWIGVDHGGLHRYNRTNHTFTYYPLEPQAPGNPFDENVMTIEEDSRGDLWIGTWARGAYKFNRKSGKSIHYMPEVGHAESLSDPNVSAILEDSRQNIWLGTFGGGLNRYDRENDKFIRIPGIYEQITIIYEDRPKNLWICTTDGLYLFDSSNNTAKLWQHDANNKQSLSDNDICSIFEDNRGDLWIGTSYGLNLFNREKDIFTVYYEKDGLPHNGIYGILEDDNGSLWLSTPKGISKFDPVNKTFTNYDASDGLQGDQFNVNACLKSITGELIFGGTNGFTIFHPDSIKENKNIPPVVITDFKIFNKTVQPGDENSPLKKQICLTKKITLQHHQHSFSFKFAALDYLNPKKNQYKYILEGFNEDWVETDAKMRVATFTNLDPGEYVFRVKGSNNHGVWNEAGAAIKIIIIPPCWQTWWFRILVFLAVIGIIFALHSYQVSRRLEMERMRIRIASDLHDDVGASLTKIAVHSEIIQTTPNPQKIIPSAKKIGDVSRDIITTMSDIIWSIDARHDTIGDLLDRMHDFVLSTLSSQQIKVTFNNHGLDHSKKISVDKRQNIYLIYKEAINNIAKHARASEVNIQIENVESEFRMIITDNGKGFAADQKQVGHGLKNMQMRAKRMGAKLVLKCDKGVQIILNMKAI